MANKKGSKDAKRKTFTSKGLKQEINVLSRKSSKAEVLDQYLTVLNKEKAKLAKKEENQMKSDDSDLDSNLFTIALLINSYPRKSAGRGITYFSRYFLASGNLKKKNISCLNFLIINYYLYTNLINV